METYATVLAYAIPGFSLLILFESLVAYRRGVRVNRAEDTISSLSSGMTNTLKTLLGLAVVIVSYDWMLEHWSLFTLPAAWWVYILAFIGLDFKGYWSHRWNHRINLFWNRHVIHHSSEEFNLSCALRQNISAIVGVYFFLYIPLALLGVPTRVIALVAPIHLFSQFWYHTRLIDRLGILEYVFVTPSHHRVHHAINDEYLDKNFSEIFIVWDKLFGTFQEELPAVPAVYGTKRPARTWNPILINYMHAWSIVQDAWRTRSWWDKLRIWFMPTGWRPADVVERYPIDYYRTAADQVKYDTRPPASLRAWSWAQLLFNFTLLYHLMLSIATFDFARLATYAGFLALSVFSYTTLMDRHPLALPLESLKAIFGFGLIVFFGGWFGLGAAPTIAVVVYLLLSLAMSAYFARTASVGTLDLS